MPSSFIRRMIDPLRPRFKVHGNTLIVRALGQQLPDSQRDNDANEGDDPSVIVIPVGRGGRIVVMEQAGSEKEASASENRRRTRNSIFTVAFDRGSEGLTELVVVEGAERARTAKHDAEKALSRVGCPFRDPFFIVVRDICAFLIMVLLLSITITVVDGFRFFHHSSASPISAGPLNGADPYLPPNPNLGLGGMPTSPPPTVPTQPQAQQPSVHNLPPATPGESVAAGLQGNKSH